MTALGFVDTPANSVGLPPRPRGRSRTANRLTGPTFAASLRSCAHEEWFSDPLLLRVLCQYSHARRVVAESAD